MVLHLHLGFESASTSQREKERNETRYLLSKPCSLAHADLDCLARLTGVGIPHNIPTHRTTHRSVTPVRRKVNKRASSDHLLY